MALKQFTDLAEVGFFGMVVILLGMIKIPALEINIWSFLARTLGRVINGEVLEKVDALTQDVMKQQKTIEEEAIRNARQRILRFDDEILFDQKHSKEHFEEILKDINMYEHYCKTHEDYENNRAVIAIDTIKKVYRKCLEERDFLMYEPKNRTDGE